MNTMNVIKLNEFGEDRFISVLNYLIETNTDKNKGWFPVLLGNYKKYVEWFFVVDDDNNLVAFSTIQMFYPGCFRVVTRCYIEPAYRRSYLPKHDTIDSPASLMVNAQIEFLKTYDTLFISLQGIHRQHTIINMSNKMEITTGLEWFVADGMFLTCTDTENSACWQNVCYTGAPPALKQMTKTEWITKYGK